MESISQKVWYHGSPLRSIETKQSRLQARQAEHLCEARREGGAAQVRRNETRPECPRVAKECFKWIDGLYKNKFGFLIALA